MSSYEEYYALNLQQKSSAAPEYFHQYVKPNYQYTDDSFGMFIGRTSLILILIALILRPASALPLAILSFLFYELTIGINSHFALPKILYSIKFPFISVFRQWYHFFPFVNFCLSLLAAIGFMSFLHICYKNKFSRSLPLIILFINLLDLSIFDYSYLQQYTIDSPTAALQSAFISTGNPLTTFMYKDRFKLTRDCSNAIQTSAFITNNYLTTDKGIDQERAIACEVANQQAVVTNIPANLVPTTDTLQTVIEKKPGQLNPWGMNYKTFSPSPTILVSELNYSLNANAIVDGTPTKLWRVNSALSGVLLTPGQHSIDFRIPAPLYFIIVCIQTLLYLFVALSLIVLANNRLLDVFSKYVQRFRHVGR